jgi:peptidylprolyl isomerase
MITPTKVVIVAAILGIGAAVIVWMQGPQAAPVETPAASPAANESAAPTSAPTPFAAGGGTQHTTASGLTIIDVAEGTGAAAKAGDNVSVQYTGRLQSNGKKFDSSYDRNEPFSFVLGQGQVIKGWDEGVAGMKVGGKRQLIIPPDLGYGANGTPDGTIPPNATLVFDVELVKIQ